MKPVKQENIKMKDYKGRFLKGYSGNPNGRPHKPEIEQLREALNIAEKQHDKSFLQHFVERAYEDNSIAIALAKKILPDLSKVSAEEFRPIIRMPAITIKGKELRL